KQLHHVRAVMAVAPERLANLRADRGLVVGKRQQPHGAPERTEVIAQQLGLRLLAALVEPLERNQQPGVSFQARARPRASDAAGSASTCPHRRVLPPRAGGGCSWTP